MPHRAALLSLVTAEQETGLSREVLRAWERRYGFPQPLRDRDGDRVYPAEQIAQLRLLRVLTGLGQRPGAIVGLPVEELSARLAALRSHDPAPLEDAAVRECMALVSGDRPDALAARLAGEIAARGLERFTIEIAAPLCVAVGLGWEQGAVSVYQEHVFSRVLGQTLRVASDHAQAGASGRRRATARVLIATVPGESHLLGMAMAEAVMAACGAACISLGGPAPVEEIAAAAKAHRCGIVALSFSAWFDRRRVEPLLRELRSELPRRIALWVGGSNPALQRVRVPGIDVFDSLDAIGPALAAAKGN